MPRSSADEACLICEQLPCACFAKPKKAAKPRAAPKAKAPAPPVTEAASTPAKQSMMDRMRARAAQAPPPTVRKIEPPKPVKARPTAASAELPALQPEQADTLRAIRLLDEAFGVDGPGVEFYRPYLNKPPGPQERAAIWRTRRSGERLPRSGGETT